MTKFNRTPWWPIKQFRFNTTNHPVMVCAESKPYQVKVSLTHNELQILEGLARILQSSTQEALRVALYEAEKLALCVDPWAHLEGPQKPTQRGLKKNQINVKLTTAEHQTLARLCEEHGLKAPALLRKVYISLAKGIRSEEIKRLTKSARINQKQLSREWQAQRNKRSLAGEEVGGSKLKPLHQAKAKARDEALERAQEEYDERGLFIQEMAMQGLLGLYALDVDAGSGEMPLDIGAIDYAMQCRVDMEEDEKYGSGDIQTKANFIRQRKSWGATTQEAEELWLEELREREGSALMEELMEEHGEDYVFNMEDGEFERLLEKRMATR